MSYDIPTVVGSGVVGLLSKSPTVATAVSNTDGSLRIYMQSAPAEAIYPLLRVVYIYGPFENKTRRKAFDVTVMVSAVSPCQDVAMELNASVVNALVDKWPEFPDPWQAYAAVTYLYPVIEKIEIQGHEYHAISSLFRFRGNEKL